MTLAAGGRMRRAKRMSLNLAVAASLILAAAATWPANGQDAATGVTLFEGARLIAGDGRAPIENSAFLVQNDRFARVGRRGDIQAPAGAVRVDLTGKTVMPAQAATHGPRGLANLLDGTTPNAHHTRENLV